MLTTKPTCLSNSLFQHTLIRKPDVAVSAFSSCLLSLGHRYINVLTLPDGQAGKACEPSNKVMLFPHSQMKCLYPPPVV
jgi:hypothetical protein